MFDRTGTQGLLVVFLKIHNKKYVNYKSLLQDKPIRARIRLHPVNSLLPIHKQNVYSM